MSALEVSTRKKNTLMMIGLGNEEKKLKMTQFPKGGNMLMGKDNNKKWIKEDG